ncbi:hypothetical protein GCM10010421_31530 [Streptomyces glaucus]|uniref:Peptidoglycan recognition protein family domain-containing protein n=2 Tax=Streptomyces glaucus TaxID=284029 RepID=A0ABP5WX45_9ACTN
MSVSIVSRTGWGAKPWAGDPAAVALSRRSEFFVHYDGGNPISYTGSKVPQTIDRAHRNQGWAGIGYNFVIDQDGTIYEGRGWGLQGAHCPGHNTTGIGVQIAIGGDQKPSDKALAACRALYEEACERTGRTLAKKGHKDGYATACPGKHLYAWVQAGMPAGDYQPTPGGSTGSPSSGASAVARYQVVINGLSYGYGASGAHITRVGEALVKRGFGKHYKSGPGPEWTDADTRNYQDFQESLGYSGKAADGVPGERSLKELLGTLPAKVTAKPSPPKYPGRDKFGPGKSNSYITQLGQQLVRKGYGKFYTQGPGPKWSEADRRNVQAFQRAQGWTGSGADGLPGPETWSRLFS